MVGPIGSGKSHLLHEWITIGTFQPEFDKIYYFYQHYQSHYGLMSKDVENIEFKEGVDFEFIQNLHNKGTKYLLIFDDSFGRFPALKFGTEMSIWMKLIKSFLMEEELYMKTVVWVFS